MVKMKFFRYLLILLVPLIFAGCYANKTVKWEDYRAGLHCITYDGEMRWQDIKEALGEADRYPIPSGENLGKNARIYEDGVIIFHVDRKKTSVDGKIRYQEVVSSVEICKNQ